MDLDQLASAGADRRCRALGEIQDSLETRRALSGVRRRGPGRLRRAALDALEYLGGVAASAPADLRVVERVVRIRRATDPVGSVMSCWTSFGDPLPVEREWMAAQGLVGKPEDHPDEVGDITAANEVAAAVRGLPPGAYEI